MTEIKTTPCFYCYVHCKLISPLLFGAKLRQFCFNLSTHMLPVSYRSLNLTHAYLFPVDEGSPGLAGFTAAFGLPLTCLGTIMFSTSSFFLIVLEKGGKGAVEGRLGEPGDLRTPSTSTLFCSCGCD